MERKNDRKTRIIKIVVLIALVVAVAVGANVLYMYSYYNPPEKVFKRTFNFDLPTSSEVINYSYSFIEHSKQLKVRIDEADYEFIKAGLLEYYDSPQLKQSEYSSAVGSGMKYVCSWWDLNIDDIIFGCDVMKEGRTRRYITTVNSSAFITKVGNEYFLYWTELW